MPETTFWFTTFEVEGVSGDVTNFDPSQSRQDLLEDSIREYVRMDEAVTESATGVWYFGAIDDRGDTIYGQFGKVFTEEKSSYDESTGVFIDDAGTTPNASYSMFILHFPLNLLIFNTKNRVGHQQFRQNFASGFNENFSGEMEANYIENRDDFETVKARHRVYRGEFRLEPSNPGADPGWKSLDDHIHEMLADHLDIEVEALEGSSLNFDDELLAEIVEMSQSPYGEFEVYYDDQGYVKKITSGDGEPIIQRDEEPDGLGGLRARSTRFIDYASTFLNQQ